MRDVKKNNMKNTEKKSNRRKSADIGNLGDVAIIGMACRFPGANDNEQYWYNIKNGVDCITEVPPGRWERDDFYSTNPDEPDKSISKWCGLIDNMDRFDNRFFNISPREANNMDPNQRTLMEEAWHCIEDSGVPLNSLQSKKTSVFVGSTGIECYQSLDTPGVSVEGYTGPGIYQFMLANRISYFWDLTGESKVVDAACASSSTALHEARCSILEGRSDYALVAGLHMHLSSYKYLLWTKNRMLSADGRCKTFDQAADGLVAGEGVAVLLLQPLEQAIKDKNHIYGVIKGSSINHGGKASSVSAPKVEAQSAVILDTYKDAGFSPETVTYIEAHGTGTSLGDPIEVEALTQAFKKYTSEKGYCKIGSSKTNIGHLMSASGIAGICKVLLMFKHKQIPPTLNVKIVNPIIDFDNSPFMLANSLTEWERKDKDIPLRAGSSSFGYGGVNVHILMEEYTETSPVIDKRNLEESHMFTLSAKSLKSLETHIGEWKRFLESENFGEYAINDICVTLLNGRGSFPFRTGKCIKSLQDLKEFINNVSSDSFYKKTEQPWCLRIGDLSAEEGRKILWVLNKYEFFNRCIEITVEKLKEIIVDKDIYNNFYGDWKSDYENIYLFIINYAYAKAVNRLGFTPSFITGQGNGVWVSLALSGIMSVEDILEIFLNQKSLADVSTARPNIPFGDFINERIIEPYLFDENYIRFLIDGAMMSFGVTKKVTVEDSRLGILLLKNEAVTPQQLEDALKGQKTSEGLLGEILVKKGYCPQYRIDRALRQQQILRGKVNEVLAHYVDKARLLNESQFTFKKFMSEWDKVIKKVSGHDIFKMLHDEKLLEVNGERDSKDKLLLLIVLTSSIRKLNEKWNFTDNKIFEEERFYELLDLISDEVMSKENIVELLTKADPNYGAIACKLNSFQGKMNARNRYKFIKQCNRNINEIADIECWIKALSETEMNVLDDEIRYLELGELGQTVSGEKGLTLNLDKCENPEEALKETMMSLWLNGFDTDWQKIYPEGTYKKVALPCYSFEREKFGIARKFIRHEEAQAKGIKSVTAGPATSRITVRLDSKLYFKYIWKNSEIAEKAGISELGSILLFDRNGELASLLGVNANKEGKEPCVLVMPGAEFSEQKGNIFTINPEKPDDYKKLLQTLKARQMLPKNIIYKWARTGVGFDQADMCSCLKDGIYSVLHLTKALAEQKDMNKVLLLFVHSPAGKGGHPLYSGMGAFFKTLRLENPGFVYKSVEMEQDNKDDVAQRLINELTLGTVGALEVRYEGKQRLVKAMEEISGQITDGKIAIKEGGVYLITGGAGGLGLIMAERLAQRAKIKLVLTGRSDLKQDKLLKLKELEALGSEILYIKADISMKDHAQRLIDEVKANFGKIDGVIHSAGIYKSGFVIKKTPEEMETVFAPKIFGAAFIDEVTKDEDMDFFIMFSSISAVAGDLGLSDYAYGNGFMDDFAELRETMRTKGMRKGRTLSINWPLWEYGGMQISKEESQRFFDRTGLNMLPTRQGLEFFDSVTSMTNILQCLVAYGDREKVKKFIEASFRDTRNSGKGQAVSMDPKVLLEKTEEFLKKIIADEIDLPVDQVDSDVSFEEYGIDSILIHNFNFKIEKHIGPTSKTLLFEYKYLKDLTEYFVKNHAAELTKLFIRKEDQDENTEEYSDEVIQAYEEETLKVKENISIEQDIAIIGISGRYPLADDLDEFWENLRNGRDCVTEVPPSRWDASEYYDPDQDNAKYGKMYSKWGGFINDPEFFDALFFKISPKEAVGMDPQERLILQSVWSSIEDAGYTGASIKEYVKNKDGRDVGVFMGATTNAYRLIAMDEWYKGNRVVPTANPWAIANRISFIFDFHGPSIPVDTACSSSLTAIHLACESLQKGDCSMAIAGGVNLHLHPSEYVLRSQLKMLSPTGRCHSFGAGADGYVPGEGVGSILLKPLNAAVEDHDHIYAVIKGTSINHGGRANGFTVPNPNAQGDLILKALRNANIDARSISLVEAHGTGTSLGDPVEISGLAKAYREYTKDNGYCAISSAKSNIGHLESASGIAGVTKLVLQFKHKKLVPSLHCEELNPNIYFDTTPFYVQRQLSDWEQPKTIINGEEKTFPRRAAISSFGAGGTNVHLILEEYQMPVAKTCEEEPELIVLSAKNDERLAEYAKNILNKLKKESATSLGSEMKAGTTSHIKDEILQMVSGILDIDCDEIDPLEEMVGYGFEPVSLTALAEVINNRFECDISSDIFKEYPSVYSISEYISRYSRDYNIGLYTDENSKESDISLKDMAYTLQVGREPMEERLAMVVSSVGELEEKLSAYCAGKSIESTYTGRVKTGKAAKLLKAKAKEQEESIKGLLIGRQLHELAQLWVGGIDINWNRLYISSTPNRVSMPTYPFTKERYWLTDMEKDGDNVLTGTLSSSLHPMIDVNVSTLEEQCFKKTLSGREHFIEDHVIEGNVILPGSAYIEMAIVAGNLSTNLGKVSKIINTVWERPLIIGKRPEELFISLYPTDNNVEYSIWSGDPAGDRFIHAGGMVSYDYEQQAKEIEVINIDSVRNRCTEHKKGEELYENLDKAGFNYQDGFKTIKNIWGNDKEALSRIILHQKLSADFNMYNLHPSILDGAFQSITGIADDDVLNSGTVYLPFALGEVEIMGQLDKECYAYAVLTKAEKNSNVKKFDIKILNSIGQTVVRIKDLSLRKYHKTASLNNEDEILLDIFRKLESGELEPDEVDRMIGNIYKECV
ncbi:SDR family NAD(P)-dependent oxidoreductase [Ruminiclostridium cellulolyticum]|uniref:Beta-ketoacyl synthase n=1 Tax=Ruminiclostridium cellulolyticum (strain ATCC 35319 / DSM 5812 / JCM 6584 / H10) TaxID=394503 RepID=B8I8J7_RUMCH|nr:SDR family NAD(P)-dependent oxidoreductase [Ruminiclostridium cellulolyticum]ACL75230.1 Beta-ketoacyl synthase [Ruminiclostridium cellulolyticum H10]